MLCERSKAKGRELVVEVLSISFRHRLGVALSSGIRAMAVNHVGHLLLGAPDRKGTEGPKRAHRGEGQSGARMIAHKLFDWLTPSNEAKDLRKLQSRKCDCDYWLSRISVTSARRKISELREMPPSKSGKSEPDMPNRVYETVIANHPR